MGWSLEGRRWSALAVIAMALGCGDGVEVVDGGRDAGGIATDAARGDGAVRDGGAGRFDAGRFDAGRRIDAGATDAGPPIDAAACPTDCSELADACHAGRCNVARGMCERVPVADGAACDDGARCTSGDACRGGTCTGVALDCSGMSTECSAGECDPTSGECVLVARPPGALCDDENACTTGDRCVIPPRGPALCAGTPRDCSGISTACATGRCDAATGTCTSAPRPDGTACDDGLRCTAGDSCRSGACGGTAIDCSSLTGMCGVGECSPATGACVRTPRPPGTTCTDGLVCTSDACTTAGLCESTLVCAAPDELELTGAIAVTPMRGMLTHTLFSDNCPAGFALVGVSGELRSGATYVGRLRGICRDFSVSGSGAGPFTLVDGGRLLMTLRGTEGGGGAFESLCPAGNVVVGFGGRSGDAIDQLFLRCAPLSISATPTEWVVRIGAATDLPPIGGAGGAAFPVTNCAAGLVASATRIVAADAVEGFGLGCQTPDLHLP